MPPAWHPRALAWLAGSAQNQGGVLAGEAMQFATAYFNVKLAAGIGHVVEIALRVGDVEIDGRREEAVAHGEKSAATPAAPQAPWGCPIMLWRDDQPASRVVVRKLVYGSGSRYDH